MNRELSIRRGPQSPGVSGTVVLPALVAEAGENAAKRFLEFFTARIRNPNTRAAYVQAVGQFLRWCEERRLSLSSLEPIHVAGYVELLTQRLAAPSVKQHLAAIRMLMDWLVTGQVLPVNPAASVKGPKHVVKKGKTLVLSAEDARTLLDSIRPSSGEAVMSRHLGTFPKMVLGSGRQMW
jgi:site-specific recombinase XerD